MPQKLIAALAAVLLIGGAAALFFSGLLGSDDAATLRWKSGDETEVALEQGAVPQTTGEANQRTEVTGEMITAGADDRVAIVLQGRVVDKFSAPVASAKVWLDFARGGPRDAAAHTRRVPEPVVTGADGVFKFEGPMFRNLRVVLHVVHRDHAPAWFDRNLGEAGSTVQLGDLPLSSGGSVLGRVTDLDGGAIASAEARLEPGDNNRIRWQRNRDQTAMTLETDRNGAFRFAHVPAGEWRVQAVAKAHQNGQSKQFKVEDDLMTELDDIQLGPGYELIGFVRDVAARPVAKATASAHAQRSGRDFRAETDAQGRFLLEHLPGSALDLTVEGEGYLRFEQRGVDPMQQTSPLQITLQDGLKITGIVTDVASSQPVTSYAVRAYFVRGLPREADAKGLAEQKMVEEAMNALRDAKGDPAQLRAQMDEMRARVEASGAELGKLRDRVRETMTRGPGRRGGDGPSMAPSPPGNMGDWGQMRDMNAWGTGGDVGKPEPHPEGRFTLTGLQEGFYVVAVQSPSHERWRSAEVELHAGAPVPELTAALDAGLDVSGTVIDAGGKPIANARAELRSYSPDRQGRRDGARGRAPDASGANGFRTAVTQFAGGGMPVLDTHTDSLGRFTLAHAPRGSYRVNASADHHQAATSEPFELQTTNVAGLVLTLGSLGGLEGTVRGLTPATIGDAHVVAVPIGEGLGSMFANGRRLTTDVTEDGRYKFDSLAPGNYAVRAFVGTPNELFREMMPSVMGNGEAPKVDVAIKVGETAHLDLVAKLPEIGTVSGTVTDNGTPAKDFHVELRPADEGNGNGGGRQGGRGGFAFFDQGNGVNLANFNMGGRSFSATTSNSGRYSIDSVPGGVYELQVSTGRRATVLYKQTITVVANKPNPVDLALVTATVTGHVFTMEAQLSSDSPDFWALQGNVSLLPGLTEYPEDFNAWRRDHTFATARIENGTFTSEVLPPGLYLLVVNARGRERTTQAISLSAGQQLQIDVTAGKPAEAKAGDPVPGKGPLRGGR